MEPLPGQPPDIRDIVPPEPVTDPALSYVLIAIVVLGIAFAIVALVIVVTMRRKRARAPKAPRADPKSAALASLADLEQSPVVEADSAAALRDLDRTVDIFLHRHFGMPALYRTREEAAAGRHGGPPPLPGFERFLPLLEALESRRYGAAHPDPADVRRLIEMARAALESAPDAASGPDVSSSHSQSP